MSFRGAFHDGLRWSISAAQTKIDWVSAVLMHFSTSDVGKFNKITAMVWPEGTTLPICGRPHQGRARPDSLQR